MKTWKLLGCSANCEDGAVIDRIMDLDDRQCLLQERNLSSSNLTGEIPPDIANLPQLQQLQVDLHSPCSCVRKKFIKLTCCYNRDLSDNSLTGPVPEFLANLQFLTMLNLSRNVLNGSVPAKLMERANQGLLDLIVDEDPSPCISESCKKKKKNNNKVVPVVASVASVLFVVVVALAILWKLKRRKQPVSAAKKTGVVDHRKTNQLHDSSKNRQFTHAQVKKMTNNFETVIGEGGFGTVFLAQLDETRVAVKILSPSSVQGYKQFQAEVELLLRVHHRNLTTLTGYCDDGSNMGLIYEYMANGNLAEHLKDSSRGVLNWEGRLGIALD